MSYSCSLAVPSLKELKERQDICIFVSQQHMGHRSPLYRSEWASAFSTMERSPGHVLPCAARSFMISKQAWDHLNWFTLMKTTVSCFIKSVLHLSRSLTPVSGLVRLCCLLDSSDLNSLLPPSHSSCPPPLQPPPAPSSPHSPLPGSPTPMDTFWCIKAMNNSLICLCSPHATPPIQPLLPVPYIIWYFFTIFKVRIGPAAFDRWTDPQRQEYQGCILVAMGCCLGSW